jgi:hypothetical protein
MTKEERQAATRYAQNCVELNPDASAAVRAREYCEDEGIPYTEIELADIAFDALYGPGSLGAAKEEMKQ